MTTPDAAVRDAYSAQADAFDAFTGDIAQTAEIDRTLVATWAERVHGELLDLGCGPGQWTAFLAGLRAEPVRGVDLVPAFVDIARARHPHVRFDVGDARALAVPDAAFGGVLAWYSLIHMPPSDLPAVFAELARVIAPGGTLLIGFFDGPDEEPFPHGVTTAYFWSIMALEDLLVPAGFTVTGFETRRDEGRRPHGSITAVRG